MAVVVESDETQVNEMVANNSDQEIVRKTGDKGVVWSHHAHFAFQQLMGQSGVIKDCCLWWSNTDGHISSIRPKVTISGDCCPFRLELEIINKLHHTRMKWQLYGEEKYLYTLKMLKVCRVSFKTVRNTVFHRLCVLLHNGQDCPRQCPSPESSTTKVLIIFRILCFCSLSIS